MEDTSLDAFGEFAAKGYMSFRKTNAANVPLTNYYAKNQRDLWVFQERTIHLQSRHVVAFCTSTSFVSGKDEHKDAYQTLEIYTTAGVDLCIRIVVRFKAAQKFREFMQKDTVY